MRKCWWNDDGPIPATAARRSTRNGHAHRKAEQVPYRDRASTPAIDWRRPAGAGAPKKRAWGAFQARFTVIALCARGPGSRTGCFWCV